MKSAFPGFFLRRVCFKLQGMARFAFLFSILLQILPAAAQSAECRPPERVTPTACDLRKQEGAATIARGLPGAFDFYVLALSWSPAFCRQARNGTENDWQCRQNRFGFVVHGLWPQYASGKASAWPQFCTPTAPVPEAILRRALCSIPSERRVQCEWAKHGVCSDQPTPEAYVDRIEKMMNRLELPDFSRNASLTIGEIAEAFSRANRARGLTMANLRIVLTREGGLAEVRLCYERQPDRFKACGETVGGLDPSGPLTQKRRVWIR